MKQGTDYWWSPYNRFNSDSGSIHAFIKYRRKILLTEMNWSDVLVLILHKQGYTWIYNKTNWNKIVLKTGSTIKLQYFHIYSACSVQNISNLNIVKFILLYFLFHVLVFLKYFVMFIWKYSFTIKASDIRSKCCVRVPHSPSDVQCTHYYDYTVAIIYLWIMK